MLNNKKVTATVFISFLILLMPGVSSLSEQLPRSLGISTEIKSISLAPDVTQFKISQEEDEDSHAYTLNVHTSISQIDLKKIIFKKNNGKKETFVKVESPGLIKIFGSGEPELPVFSKLIEVPLNAVYRRTIEDRLDKNYEIIDLKEEGFDYKSLPAQPPQIKDSIPEFVYNQDVYRKTGFIEKDVIFLEELGILRSARIFRLEIRPIQYNPVDKKLRIKNNLNVKIEFIDANYKKTKYLKEKYSSPLFNDILKRFVTNFKPYTLGQVSLIKPVVTSDLIAPSKPAITKKPIISTTQEISEFPNLYQSVGANTLTVMPVTYVIVSNVLFEDNPKLKEFIEWKKKWYHVIVAYCGDYETDQIGDTSNPARIANNKDSIKNYLKEIYDNPPEGLQSHDYLLLVGDANLIKSNPDQYILHIDKNTNEVVSPGPDAKPTYHYHGNHVTDFYYAEYTGDILPDAFYGRFSAQNAQDLEAQISKTIAFEKKYVGETQGNLSYLSNVVLISGNEESAPFAEAVNYATDNYFNSDNGINPCTFKCTEHADRPTFSDDIRSKIDVGSGIVYYTGHGTPKGWFHSNGVASGPDLYFLQSLDIQTLNNQDKYGLWIGNCCKSNKFYFPECSAECFGFGEAVLRIQNKGAIGYIGAINKAYKEEDLWWAVGQPKANSSTLTYYDTNLGAFDRLFHTHGENPAEWYTTNGQIVVAGNLAVSESTSLLKTYYWEIYHLMGDPSLSVFPSPNNSSQGPNSPTNLQLPEYP